MYGLCRDELLQDGDWCGVVWGDRTEFVRDAPYKTVSEYCAIEQWDGKTFNNAAPELGKEVNEEDKQLNHPLDFQ